MLLFRVRRLEAYDDWGSGGANFVDLDWQNVQY